MIIVKIIGGLGNQMFQYAYAKALKQKGFEVKIDISEFNTYKLHGGYQLNKYAIDLEHSTTIENAKYNNSSNLIFRVLDKLHINYTKNIIKEKNLLFDQKFLTVKDDCYITGYFQCEKYFSDIKNILIQQFQINKPLSSFTIEMEKKILESNNSCSIHIRRGDYTNKNNMNFHGVCSLEYYQNAIEIVNNQCGDDVRYFVFSDDMKWVKENMKIENTVYIDSSEKRIPHEDIYLMCT